MTAEVHYRVSMSRPHSHLFEVEARFPAQPGPLTVALPVWTPGSYLVREYARQLQDVSALADGRPAEVVRVDKRSFRVDAPGAEVVFRYRVYANELTVRTSHLDGTHGYFNGATVFLYDEGLRHGRHVVEVVAPEGWRAFSALPQENGAFVAPDYDTLVDSPFEVGPHQPLTFTAAGVPHEVIVWGDAPPDPEKLTADLKKVVEAEAALFGGLPLERYLFLVYLTDRGRGGLEHAASTSLLFPRVGLQNPKGWEDFLTLAAHEYFHLWNIKRVKPKGLVPFDYAQENYTTLLWAFEGMTSYYDNVLVRRAGLISGARYLTRLGETLSMLHATPGRKTQTLADASFNAWIKHYRPDENSINSAISYYLKGEVVCALLDLELRRLTNDQRSLDDLVRLLFARHGDGSGVTEDGIEKAASEIAGHDLTAFFDRAIRSTEELDYSPFAHVGLEVRYRVRESASDKGGSAPRVRGSELRPRGWLGIVPKSGAGISAVLDGSPAQEAGLYTDDEVVALDGWKCDAPTLVSRCDDRKPGETVRVTVFRRERVIELQITLGQKPADALYLARTERVTEQQKASFKAWLHVGYDDGAGERA